VQFPHRRGWHTDQSYRRPPPDVSLFLAVVPVPQGQGQTLFADGIAAYAALPAALKARVDGLEGLHVSSSAKRGRDAVLAGEAPLPLAPHKQPQRQPVVREHPVTGERALYLCEYGQMDWVDGPFQGLEPGPHGEGARLLHEIMAHLTQPEFVYVHEWTPGDLVIWDNRCTVHAATWFDAERLERVMWRTTVSGNPGAAYAGERKSWLRA
jgi:taurine dioxygenase